MSVAVAVFSSARAEKSLVAMADKVMWHESGSTQWVAEVPGQTDKGLHAAWSVTA